MGVVIKAMGSKLAGAVVMMGKGSAKSKITAFKEAGVHVANTPSNIAEILLKSI